MPELRKDPVLGRWVIVSTERGKRPSDFPARPKTHDPKLCPFCPGSEALTPPEVFAVRPDNSKPNSPGWTLRVISNKYPALKIEGELNREGEGMFDKMNGVGAHEVIIETPHHHLDLADLPVQEIEMVIDAYRIRMIDLRKDMRFRYVMLFKNQGEAAGASLEHAHSQLIATPVIPKRVLEEIKGSKLYYDYKERCVFCDIIHQELSQGVRVVAQNEEMVAIEPFAARFPFETWILPKRHSTHFDRAKDKECVALASILKEILLKFRIALNDPPFNYIIHTGALTEGHDKEYHWHVELFPKLTRIAGFEWGTGFYINPTPPEAAADFLNEIDIDAVTSIENARV
jgi:UDPglucose--hexose-1-phosphate uridylyltransferase